MGVPEAGVPLQGDEIHDCHKPGRLSSPSQTTESSLFPSLLWGCPVGADCSLFVNPLCPSCLGAESQGERPDSRDGYILLTRLWQPSMRLPQPPTLRARTLQVRLVGMLVTAESSSIVHSLWSIA